MDSPDSPQTVRHPAREHAFEPAADTDPGQVQAIEDHIALHFGRPEQVWHELVPDLVHLDVHLVPACAERPWLTLVTCGMSARPMAVPSGAPPEHRPHAELMMALPADWPVTGEDEAAYWPIRLLKTIARLPHAYRTWIGPWHSIPNGDPAVPYAPGVPFTAALVAPMVQAPPEAAVIATPSGLEISLLALVPLHPAELELKVTSGAGALLDPFDDLGVSEVLNPTRPSAV